MDIDKINSYVNRAQLGINDYVNKAQIDINDWQCSGDVDYLAKAVAHLRAALTKAERKND